MATVTDEKSFDGIGKSLLATGKGAIIGVEAYPKIVDNDTRIHIVYFADGVGNELTVQGGSVQAKMNVHAVVSPLVQGSWAVAQVRVATMTDWGNKVNASGHQLSFLQIYTTPGPGPVARLFIARVAITEGEDRSPPGPASNLSAELVDGVVSVAWTASVDNVCTASYRVHRGMTADFIPTRENRIGDSTTVRFSDGALGNFGTYFYRIVPVDIAGNIGVASDAVRIAVIE
ncbi:MAG: hypothetical protein H0V44_00660 [Planctomycetes bacterium]|nr:hypothetical protein [Planctomycetota bacterium]